jgi:sec-independent protein translocase protein TatB
MFGVGFTELLAVAVIALIFIGPEDLPKFARNIGRILNDLKRGSDNFVNEFKSAADLKNFDRMENDIKTSLDLDTKSGPKLASTKSKEESSDE